MNNPVAASERGDKRATPQTPCPLVQPEPYRVPKPTSKPAPISTGSDASIVAIGTALTMPYSVGAANNPPINATRHAVSPLPERSRPPTIPLIPATRPLNNINSDAA